MLKDVDSVKDAKVPTSIPVKSATPAQPSFERHDEESGLGAFRGMMFALPLAIILWLSVGLLIYLL